MLKASQDQWVSWSCEILLEKLTRFQRLSAHCSTKSTERGAGDEHTRPIMCRQAANPQNGRSHLSTNPVVDAKGRVPVPGDGRKTGSKTPLQS
jgi:hypothetical protein